MFWEMLNSAKTAAHELVLSTLRGAFEGQQPGTRAANLEVRRCFCCTSPAGPNQNRTSSLSCCLTEKKCVF